MSKTSPPRRSTGTSGPTARAPSSTIGGRTNKPHWGDLATVPPSQTHNPIKRYLWEWRVWLEATFGLSMLEPWEKLMITGTVGLILTLLMFSVYYYLPQHVSVIWRRAKYYAVGEENLWASAAGGAKYVQPQSKAEL